MFNWKRGAEKWKNARKGRLERESRERKEVGWERQEDMIYDRKNTKISKHKIFYGI